MGLVCPIIFTCIGAVLVILGAVLGWAVIPPIIDDQVKENVILKEGTLQYDRWEEVPFPIDFKVYFFNVKNPAEILRGAKPILEEVGPYVYDQLRKKQPISKVGEDYLEYNQTQYYTFNETKSKGLKDTDRITILNVPYNAILQVAASKSDALLSGLSLVLNSVFGENNGMFLTTTVKEFLFDGVKICRGGEPQLVCDEIKKEPAKTMTVEEDGTISIALFNHKNWTHDGRYKINDGQKDVSQLARIDEWDGSSKISMWIGENSTCNMINGTDNTIYAPFVDKKKPLEIFNTDICRSVTTHFHEDLVFKGVNAYRFKAFEDALPAPSKEDVNDCFCLKETVGIVGDKGCLLDGTMELYPCFDSHVVLSFPHFLMAHETYQNGVEGLSPDSEKHQIFLDIEPLTGTPLRGGKRAQFSMFIRRLNPILSTLRINTTLIPFLWVDEGIELPDEYIDELNEKLFSKLVIVDAVRWTLIAVGAALFVVFIIVIIYMKTRKVETV